MKDRHDRERVAEEQADKAAAEKEASDAAFNKEATRIVSEYNEITTKSSRYENLLKQKEEELEAA